MTQTIKATASAELDTQTHTIRLRRSMPVPAMKVFEAWTTPDIVARWWDPTGTPLRSCEIDLRPGGAFRFVNEEHGDGQAFSGTYREIAPPDRLAFEAMGAQGLVLFSERDGRTDIVVTIVCASAEQLAMYMEMGIVENTGKTLDNLVAYFGA